MVLIFAYLEVGDLCRCLEVCRWWKVYASQNALWRRMVHDRFPLTPTQLGEEASEHVSPKCQYNKAELCLSDSTLTPPQGFFRALYLELFIGNALSINISFGQLTHPYKKPGRSAMFEHFLLDVGYEGVPISSNENNKLYKQLLNSLRNIYPNIEERNSSIWAARTFGWYYDKPMTYPSRYPMYHFARNRWIAHGRRAGRKPPRPSSRFELDTLIHLPQNVRWQMKVQPGRYLVTLTIGDAVS